MIDLTLDMEQYDCPFIDTSDDHAVSFSAVQWQFDSHDRCLETRMVVDAEDRAGLESGLSALRRHPNMREYTLFKKRDGAALVRTTIDETNAMATVRANDGYITGPFRIEDGREQWKVGFDDERGADVALAELERHNEFAVESRETLGLEVLFDLLDNAEAATELLDGCRTLTDVERRTLAVAAENDYFEQPRGATLETLASEFDVSGTAVSKNVRRAERKVLHRVVNALDRLE